MFRKRIRKEVPEETFISKPARVMAILQLCLVFTVMIWHAGYPFLGELFDIKSTLSVYQHVMGIHNPSHGERFEALPAEKKNEILTDYEAIQAQYHRPFITKLFEGCKRLLFGFSPFKFLWVLFSIIIPILLLKKVDGAATAIWLLPLVTLVFIIHNRWYAEPASPSRDTRHFPTEEYLVTHYLSGPLSSGLKEQETQLRRAWELYLIHEWAKETPSSDSEVFDRQKEQGDFAFHLKRLEYLKPQEIRPLTQDNYQESYYILGLYLFWNLSFALVVSSAMQTSYYKGDMVL